MKIAEPNNQETGENINENHKGEINEINNVEKRSRKMTEKGREYKVQCSLEEKNWLFRRIMRRANAIDDLSKLGNTSAIEESMTRFNELIVRFERFS